MAADPAAREAVMQTIRARDSEFWAAYNTCDTSHLDRFFTPDVEFYHDRGGITLGLDALVQSIRKNLCGGPNPILRRESVPGSDHLSLLENGQEIYGAVLTGEHVFFVLEAGKPPRLDGRARYVDLWLKRDGDFKMARVLSYDHGPATVDRTGDIVSLTSDQLERCVGKFHAPRAGEILITREQDHLVLSNGGKLMPIFPINETTFIPKDRDLTFEFQMGNRGPVKLIVREHGEKAEEALPSP